MKKTILVLFVACSVLISCNNQKEQQSGSLGKDFVVKSFDVAEVQLTNAITQYQDLTKFPRSTNPDGTLHARDASNWVSGFFPGCLWLMYEYSEDEKWEIAAKRWTEALSEQQFNTGTHDIGFMIGCSYGQGYKLTKNEEYKSVLIEAATSLMTRYNEDVGCIKSWDWSKEWKFPVIIDNMMNLELLFEASKLTGDESFRNAAIDHAETTIEHHFRPDYSSYHVIDYDPETGDVLGSYTHQGISDESAWARGQAWGLYGYTVCYRETKNEAFLKQAEQIAGFIIDHPATPDDLIPYWDYDAPGIPNEPRDASAAAIIAAGLLELSTYTKTNDNLYFNKAEQILKSLASYEYLATPGSNNNFILKHSTGHKPGNSEIDVPLIYGDYFFLEALLRFKKLKG